MRKEVEQLRINKKQTVILSLAICFLLITGAYFFFRYESNLIHQKKFDELKTIAQLKIERISEWQKARMADVNVISRSQFLTNSIEQLKRKTLTPAIFADLKKHLNNIKSQLSYSDVFVVSPEGKILLSSGEETQKLDNITYNKINEALKLREITNTDLYFSPVNKKIFYEFVSPIFDKSNLVIALTVFRIDPSTNLYPSIQLWPTPSKSAEIVICRKEGDSVLFLNELRYHKDSSLNYKLPISMKNVPAIHVVLGNSGIFKGYDYRGVEVVSYISSIPGTSWFMVAKVDHKEMFDDLYGRETALFLFTAVLILLFCGGLILFYNVSRKGIYKELFLREKELREYHEEFKTILYSIGDGVITTDTSGRVKQINQTAANLTGWNEPEAAGKSIEEVFKIINEDSRKEVENPVKRVLEKGVIVGLANHTMLLSRNGKETPIADSGAPILSEAGEIEGTVLVFRDKTEEHIAEKAIRQSETRLQRAEFVSKFGYFEINFNAKTVIASEGAKKIYGVSGSGWSLNDIQNIVLPEYREKLDNALRKMLETGDSYDEEFKIKTIKTGKIVDVYSHADYDKVNGTMFGIIQDITERKNTGKELELYKNHLEDLVESRTEEIDIINKELSIEIEKKRETEKLLQESLEKEKELSTLKSRFISTASHEFRTPLAAVLSSAEMIQRYSKTWSEEKFSQHIERIKNSVEYLTKLMDGVLTLSRADAGKIKFNPQPVDLHQLCLRIVEESQINESDKHEIVFNYQPGQKIYTIDSNQINVVLQNLISNAFKYSPNGGKIEFNVSSCDNAIQFSVKDEGIGIPEKELPELFQSFHRASNTVSIKGTGLGLSIVKNAVELLKGNITVKSEIDKGSTFVINIPIEMS
jgi:PAS domain S-box-containing protein